MAGRSLTEFANEVSEVMHSIMRDVCRQEASEFCKIHITLPQFVVLEILGRSGPMRMSDLARQINVSTAAVTGIVDRLVKSGYVERTSDDGDRRIIKVSRTAKGSKTVDDAIEMRKRMFCKMFEAVSRADRETYLRILKEIRNSIKE